MWRRLWIAWACIVALAFAAATASAASGAPEKPHQGTSEFSAALNVCANALTTVEAHTGKASLPTTETSDVPDAARAAPKAIDPNKLHHIFGQAKHKLGPLLEKFGGSQEATFRAVEAATQKAVGP